MARKPSNKDKPDEQLVREGSNQKARYSAEWRKFVNVELSKAEKEEFITWAGENNFFAVLDKECRKGRKFTVAYDFTQTCFLATCMERDKQSPNAGLMVSARAIEPDLAMWRLLYIVDALFGEDRWESLVDLTGDRW